MSVINVLSKGRLLVFVLLSLYARGWGVIDSLIILHTNDLHAHIQGDKKRAGAARIGALFKKTKARRPDVLILDAGDAIMGTPVSSKYKGVPIFEIMTAMGYDAAGLGNHEFDFGWSMIKQYRDAAKHPFLCVNVFDSAKNAVGDAPYMVIDIDNVLVGVMGVVTGNLMDIISQKNNIGLRVLDPVKEVKKYIPDLKKIVDIIIVLSHLGVDADTAMARQLQDIDIIIGGHSHTIITEPLKIGKVIVAQAGAFGEQVGYLKVYVDLDKQKRAGVKGGIIPLSKIPEPDSAIDSLVQYWEAKVSKEVDVIIGKAKKSLNKKDLRPFIEKVLKKRTKAHVGYYNDGGIRATIQKGPVSIRDIWNVEPFGNTIVKVKMPGSRIGGKLKTYLKENKFKIKPAKEYIIAANSFMAEHPVNFFGTDSLSIEDTGIGVREALIEYVKKKKSIK